MVDGEIQPLYEKVIKGEFKLEFTEPGEIESAENIEINCEVKSRSSAGVSILEIVPEGTVVEKGDFLVRLDDAVLQKDLLTQRIRFTGLVQLSSRQRPAPKLRNLHWTSICPDPFAKKKNKWKAPNSARENLRRAEEHFATVKACGKGILARGTT